MPTGNAYADAMTAGADRVASSNFQDVLSGGVLPEVNIKPTLDPNSYVQQSTDLLKGTYNNPAISKMFGQVDRSGQAASGAMDIIEERYLQENLKKLPLDSLQSEVEDLQARRTRVLPEMLASNDITDYKTKIRLASMVQSMFDREIDKTLSKKKDLEDGAASRARMKVQEMQAKANVLDKRLENDKYLMSQALDLYSSGAASLQDVLEQAIQMEENNSKRKKAGGTGTNTNPFVGMPGASFEDWEIAAFLAADRNQGRLELADSSGEQYRLRLNARYREWMDSGRPVPNATRAYGPAEANGRVPVFMEMLQATTDESKAGQAGYYQNPYPQRSSTTVFNFTDPPRAADEEE